MHLLLPDSSEITAVILVKRVGDSTLYLFLKNKVSFL